EVYNDETLRFCRTDGVALVDFDSDAPTAIFDSILVTGAATAKVSSRARSAKLKSIDSIAVLPFENVGEDPNAEYLSDGITESIINNLSQLSKLKVMARSTVFRY